MPRLEPVIWTKGTFLNPQHLQSQDRFLEETLQFDLQALEFRPWGFRHLRIDQAALAAGTLVVSEAAGIFPDGLLFDIPESDPAPAAKPLAEHFDAETKVWTSIWPSPATGSAVSTWPARGGKPRPVIAPRSK